MWETKTKPSQNKLNSKTIDRRPLKYCSIKILAPGGTPVAYLVERMDYTYKE